MKKRPSTLHKWFSWSRWQRRFGARHLIKPSAEADFTSMKSRIIDAGDAVMTRGSAKDVQEHHAALRREFSGQSELALHHAFLIVLIRRDYDLANTVKQFETLWSQEADWLLQNLNVRWLVSACDTFADHASDPTTRAFAVATSLLANTVKIYETENVMSQHTVVEYAPEVVARVQQEAIPLFEGMSCFTVGTDDTLRNMVWRLQAQTNQPVTGRILAEVLNRFNQSTTAYGRLLAAHTRAKTQWW